MSRDSFKLASGPGPARPSRTVTESPAARYEVLPVNDPDFPRPGVAAAPGG